MESGFKIGLGINLKFLVCAQCAMEREPGDGCHTILVDAHDWQTQKRIRAKLQPPQVVRVCPYVYLFLLCACISALA